MAFFPNITSSDGIWKLRNTSKYIQGQNWTGLAFSGTNAIFGFGFTTTYVNTITRFDNTGSIIGSEGNAGTARRYLAAATYGGDKAIFGFGEGPASTVFDNITRFDNTGSIIGSEGNAGTARRGPAAASYG